MTLLLTIFHLTAFFPILKACFIANVLKSLIQHPLFKHCCPLIVFSILKILISEGCFLFLILNSCVSIDSNFLSSSCQTPFYMKTCNSGNWTLIPVLQLFTGETFMTSLIETERASSRSSYSNSGLHVQTWSLSFVLILLLNPLRR